jgi:hypothetical protein
MIDRTARIYPLDDAAGRMAKRALGAVGPGHAPLHGAGGGRGGRWLITATHRGQATDGSRHRRCSRRRLEV